jgi:hypothetical protein
MSSSSWWAVVTAHRWPKGSRTMPYISPQNISSTGISISARFPRPGGPACPGRPPRARGRRASRRSWGEPARSAGGTSSLHEELLLPTRRRGEIDSGGGLSIGPDPLTRHVPEMACGLSHFGHSEPCASVRGRSLRFAPRRCRGLTSAADSGGRRRTDTTSLRAESG